ncbi:MAG: TetR/AcrR family transcriptional regulator [Synergistaceae bacterium]|jgi:AcrR family transcriptional regulator|nr:TetR/AcrR family transcriptional regulator [Synergistaceae bacterium]
MAQKNGNGDSSRERLIKAGINLFSKYGYDATSTRMISKEAGVSLSAISFHFDGKDSLFSACLDLIAEKISSLYEKTSKKTERLLENGIISKQEAYECLMEVIRTQVAVAFGHRYRSSLMLTYWEQTGPSRRDHPVSEAIFKKIENSMAKLITSTTDIPYERAIIASRFINGSIISFGEHSLLVYYAIGDEEGQKKKLELVSGEILRYCDVLIRELLQMPQENAGPLTNDAEGGNLP